MLCLTFFTCLVCAILTICGHAQQFYPAENYEVFDNPGWILSGDYDLDGNMDIFTHSGLSVLLGTGSGRFQPFIAWGNFGGVDPVQGDFDQDGYLDIALGGTIHIAINLGNGTFADPYQLPGYTGGSHYCCGDFNNDMIPDIVSDWGILLGLGGGNFSSQTPIPDLGNNVFPVDLDRNGNLDLLSSTPIDDNVIVHLGNGDGTFGIAQFYATEGSLVRSIVSTDLNNDGWPDVVVSNGDSDNISILLGTGSGNLGSVTLTPTAENPGEAVTGNFNADTFADIAFVCMGGSNLLSVLYGDGAGGIAYSENYGIGSPYDITTADYNNDGNADLAVAMEGNYVSVFINTLEPPAPPVQVTLDPINPPIQIPASGGTFDFDITVENSSPQMVRFDVWMTITLPGGYTFETTGPIEVTLPDSSAQTRTRGQNVPATAPAGWYTFTAMLGLYPWQVLDSDEFLFEKLATGEGEMSVGDWENYGEQFTDACPSTPTKMILYPSYPNPFNPTTTISFALPGAAWVELEVYDIRGREIGSVQDRSLQNGWRDAGVHEVTFDGSGLASGIYIYRLEAGNFSANGKMVLVK